MVASEEQSTDELSQFDVVVELPARVVTEQESSNRGTSSCVEVVEVDDVDEASSC